MTKICPHCQQAFECRNDNILECDCINIILNAEDYSYIGSRYADCLCCDCLRAIHAMPEWKKAV